MRQVQHGAKCDAHGTQHHDDGPQQAEQTQMLQGEDLGQGHGAQGFQPQREQRRSGDHSADLGGMPILHGRGKSAVSDDGIDAGKDQAARLQRIQLKEGRRGGEWRQGQGSGKIDEAHDAPRRDRAQQDLLGDAVAGPDHCCHDPQRHADEHVTVGQLQQPGIEEQQKTAKQDDDAAPLDGEEGLAQDEHAAQQQEDGARLCQDLAGRGAEVGHRRVEEHEVAAQARSGQDQQDLFPAAQRRAVAGMTAGKAPGPDSSHPEAQADDGERVHRGKQVFEGQRQGPPE